MITTADAATPAGPLTVTRRRVLLLGCAGVAALGARDAVALVARASSAVEARGLRRSDYAPHIGQRFRLVPPDGTAVSARLVRVDDFPGRVGRGLAGSEVAFILIFRAGLGEPRAGQAVMSVVHPGGGARDLLLSPAGSAARSSIDYAAVINRLTPPGGTQHV